MHYFKVCTGLPSKDQLREYMLLFDEYCDHNKLIHIDSFKAIVSKLGGNIEKFAFKKLERDTKSHNHLLTCRYITPGYMFTLKVESNHYISVNS